MSWIRNRIWNIFKISEQRGRAISQKVTDGLSHRTRRVQPRVDLWYFLVDEVAVEQISLIFISAFLCHTSYLHCYASYLLLYYGNRMYAVAHTRHNHVLLLKFGTSHINRHLVGCKVRKLRFKSYQQNGCICWRRRGQMNDSVIYIYFKAILLKVLITD
jgi:hypothetical protein